MNFLFIKLYRKIHWSTYLKLDISKCQKIAQKLEANPKYQSKRIFLIKGWQYQYCAVFHLISVQMAQRRIQNPIKQNILGKLSKRINAFTKYSHLDVVHGFEYTSMTADVYIYIYIYIYIKKLI